GAAALVFCLFLGVGLVRLATAPRIAGEILADLQAIRERDPAAESLLARMCYPGWCALVVHRLVAHPLYLWRLRTLARLFNFLARFLTGADIHPGAQFGSGIFIDHAHGVVVGETAIVGNNVTILHQVTLGGTGKETGKRHPTIQDGVLLSAGCKVLGNIVVGANSKIGAGSVVVHTVPPESTVVGVPGRVVAGGGHTVPARQLDQTSLPDPLVERLLEFQEELRRLKEDQSARLRQPVRPAEVVKGPRAYPGDILAEIVAHTRDEVAADKAALPLGRLREKESLRPPPRSLANALKGPGLALIAELKKASPSAGLLRADFDLAAIARTYEQSHAAALSVLTNARYFQGSLDHLAAVRAAVKLPLLRKDFIVDEYQIVQAERYGADAVLLIVACLEYTQLRDFRELAEGEGLDALVEVHNEEELELALKSSARLIGINNRNLKTLETDLETTFRLAARLPRRDRNGVLLVSESGIRGPQDTERLLSAGIDAVLIGETFMRAPDIAQKVREVMGGHDYSI
ncbi:MAG: indole-3-glycerol phosphate synthase TrpC, partial [Planctomycetota bacterium]